MSSEVWRRLLENWKRTVCATRGTEIKLPRVTIKAPVPIARKFQYFFTTPSTSSRLPGYPSAILVFALTHSRRAISMFNAIPWLAMYVYPARIFEQFRGRARAASHNQAKRGRGPTPFGIGATRDIVYRRRSGERDLDSHGQPQHRTL